MYIYSQSEAATCSEAIGLLKRPGLGARRCIRVALSSTRFGHFIQTRAT